MSKIKLNVLGLSYSQTQSGAYALVLSEESGERRIPIIIGGFEAQAIAIELEGLKPPRPLTHDLFVSFAGELKAKLLEVNIHKLEEGVFYSELVCDHSGKVLKMDARTSDAVALALRFKCPIYTTEEIMSKAGIILEIEEQKKPEDKDPAPPKQKKEKKEYAKPPVSSTKFGSMTKKELEDILQKAIEEEDYERASEIRDELNRRSKK